MGFGLVLIWNLFITNLLQISMILLMVSGALYSGGVIFYVLGNYRPIYHVIWHLCVLVAALIMWFDVYFHIVTTSSMAEKYAAGIVNSFS